jgi:lipopolysaccharide export system protein LptA
MKKILFLILAVFLFAAELKITSQKFIYDSKKRISIFIGNVKAIKEEDEIIADKLSVYFNKNKKPVKIVAEGNVKFKIKMDKDSTYKGRAKKLIYDIKTGDIILIGDAYVVKLQTNESISGDKIKINRITKNIEVIGSPKRPVNIIIKVNE